METLLLSLQMHIVKNMPELSLVDEDYGQLKPKDETYPISFPCVLLEPLEIQWTSGSNGSQEGKGSIRLKLAIDSQDETLFYDTSENKIEDCIKMLEKLHSLVHGFGGESFSPLWRISSNGYFLPGKIKVYECNYTYGIKDSSAVPKMIEVHNVKIQIN